MTRNLLLAMTALVTTLPMIAAAQTKATPAAEPIANNPFAQPSTLPFEAPPFDRIKDSDYQPALLAGMAQQRAEIARIANNPAAPTFDNTIVALEKSGRYSNGRATRSAR